jgi:hypothetical protein
VQSPEFWDLCTIFFSHVFIADLFLAGLKDRDALLPGAVKLDLAPSAASIVPGFGGSRAALQNSIMKLEEVSLRKFLEGEPDIYTLEDLKVRYK